MNLEGVRGMARSGRLYPAVILHGADPETRVGAAVEIGRTLLCDRAPGERPCGACRHCRRVAWPAGGEAPFHPDFQVLERDLRTATSVAATKAFLQTAQVAPFEARGQVFVVASAETLTGEAANALLKILEEPPVRAPRHFLLLSPSRFDLLPTIRSRSLAVYLGPAASSDDELIDRLAGDFTRSVEAYRASGLTLHLLAAAATLGAAGGWDDPRASRPWSLAAAAVARCAERGGPEIGRRRLLALAEELLGGPRLRVRGIAPQRILEGLVVGALARAAHPSP